MTPAAMDREMTDARNTRPPAPARTRATAPSRRRPRLVVTAAAALAGFFVVFQLLAFQLRSGGDPALGAGRPIASVKPAVVSGHAPGTASSAIATRASGAPPAATPTAAPAGPTTAAAAPTVHHAGRSVVTRASGAGPRNSRNAGEREGGDEA